jgi:DNA repair photolyase
MIISASRRTDIPAFYSDWFMQRIHEKYCTVVNPFNRKQVTRVSLLLDDVDVIVFWTKNAKPILPYLHELDALGYRYYFQYTLNGYGTAIEPHVPNLDASIETFLELSAKIGAAKVIWRYDPIIFSNRTDEGYHREKFAYILEKLQSATKRIVVSVVDDYRKAAANFRSLLANGIEVDKKIDVNQLNSVCSDMSRRAWAANLPIYSCAEQLELSSFGILPGKCIDADLVFDLFGIRVSPEKDKSQRQECGCVKSKDIGYYDTCLHGCAYCYAGTFKAAVRNRDKHKPTSPSLIDS